MGNTERNCAWILQQKHLDIAHEIKLALRNDDLQAITRSTTGSYEPWYATLLSSIALLADDEQVVYAHSDYSTDAADVTRLDVSTTNLLIPAGVEPDFDGLRSPDQFGASL